jgi:hypothetical protein
LINLNGQANATLKMTPMRQARSLFGMALINNDQAHAYLDYGVSLYLDQDQFLQRLTDTHTNPALLVCGGQANGTTQPLSSCELYTSLTGVWSTGTPLPLALMTFAMITLNGRAYVFGGVAAHSLDAQATNLVYSFDSSTSVWSVLAAQMYLQAEWTN